ncbi:MAG: endopeptidase La [Nitrospirae bacterium GWC2_56_14]|nr:MAG: endopeptidase La [Nitrospirae bacterium GWC2_56_14]
MAKTESKNIDLQQSIEIPKKLPLLPIRDIVVFPYMVLPLFVGREMSIKAIEVALESNRMIFLTSQKDINIENPSPSDLYSVGTVGVIMRMLKLPDGRIKILVQGVSRARTVKFLQKEPFYQVEIKTFPDVPLTVDLETEALMRNVKEQIERLVSFGKVILPDIMVVIENVDDPGKLADLAIANMGLKVEQAQEILEITDPVLRIKRINEALGKEIELLSMQQKIQADVRGEIDKTQREYFLREQLKAIQRELGETDDRSEDMRELREKIKDAKLPEKAGKEAEKQLRRLERMHPDAAEASMTRTYIEWLAELPWSKATKDNLDLKMAHKILEEDHYDLEKVKERIIEYLAVRKLKEKMKGPILCFVGPPGVGKTSLGKSIARALGREFVRISLGGVRDEAEIRGHRRTYVGALPGRIIQGIKTAGNNNPVFMLDEIDKIGADFRGDPSAALLEVLDPEQNNSFSDHYIGLPFDLSRVMFITTANMTDPIPGPLKDRMEIIRLSGYTEQEKLGIAKSYLIPRQLTEHGITDKQIGIADKTLIEVISQYTREAGVRNLEREIGHLCRKVARKVAEGEDQLYTITPQNLHTYLGVQKFMPEVEREKNEIGVVTGLAWTETGGDILYIEATSMLGKGQLTLTGHLGDVMKESAHAALTYVRSRAEKLGINPDVFAKTDVHIHVPAGAIPKDGPSAGVTMATALASVFTNTPVRKDIAMTGEVTLRGRVMPIGGLKEKTLAARRAGIKTVIVPKENEKDIEDFPKYLRKDMNFIFATTVDDVLAAALEKRGKGAAKVDKKTPKKSARKKIVVRSKATH